MLPHPLNTKLVWLFLQLSDLALIYNIWDDGMGQTGSSVLWFVGMNLSSESQSLHYCQGYNIIFHDTGERNRGYALLMMANKLETVWTELPIFLFYLRHLVDLFMLLNLTFPVRYPLGTHTCNYGNPSIPFPLPIRYICMYVCVAKTDVYISLTNFCETSCGTMYVMLSLSLSVYQVRLKWLPLPCIVLIRPSQLGCLVSSLVRASAS